MQTESKKYSTLNLICAILHSPVWAWVAPADSLQPPGLVLLWVAKFPARRLENVAGCQTVHRVQPDTRMCLDRPGYKLETNNRLEKRKKCKIAKKSLSVAISAICLSQCLCLPCHSVCIEIFWSLYRQNTRQRGSTNIIFYHVFSWWFCVIFLIKV